MVVVFLIGSSLISMLSTGFAAKLAGFRNLNIMNLAITTNARGGPALSWRAWHSMRASSMRSFTRPWF